MRFPQLRRLALAGGLGFTVLLGLRSGAARPGAGGAGSGDASQAAGSHAPAATTPGSEPQHATGRMRGICWEGSSPITRANLQPLRDLGADWISQTPFGWSHALDAPEVRLATERVWWGESDSGIVQTAAMARALGIRTLLKPHLWIHHGEWVGDLAMRNEADWQRWFVAYQIFILHYAAVAESAHVEGLAIGTELSKTTSHTADWRRIIAAVRRVYHGPITYCANWNAEAEAIQFWDALDFVGVQAYYPLCSGQHAAEAEIRAAWAPYVARLAALAKRTGKPIVFTEVGYKSVAGGLKEPWVWEPEGEQDLDLQRDAYRALFETFWTQPWFGGTFIWKWHGHLMDGMGPEGRDFTPQGKPALAVIRQWYGGGGAARGSAGAGP